MNATARVQREELKSYIDDIPEESFDVVRKLLLYINETQTHLDEPIVIEPADEEEKAMIKKAMKEYEANPNSFITLEEYCRSRGIEPILKIV